MSMIFALMLAAQTTSTQQTVEAFGEGMKAQDAAFKKMFACMDAAVKVELKARVTTATPESVTDAALKSCSATSDEMRLIATRTLTGAMSADAALAEATKIQADTIAKLRETYVKHLDDMLSKPALADSRVKIVTAEWSLCVKQKAVAWSKLRDDGRTVAQAAVTACNDKKENLKPVLRYMVRSQNLPASAVDQIEGTLTSRINENAVAWVVEERAKGLPK